MSNPVGPPSSASFAGLLVAESASTPQSAPLAADSVFRLALFNQYNLILLAGAGLFSVAFASPWPGLVGVAAELLFLTVGVNTARVRGWAQRQIVQNQARAEANRIRHADQGLEPFYANRVAALTDLSHVIRSLASERGFSRNIVGPANRMTELLGAFTQLAVEHQRLSRILTEAPTGPISAQVAGLEASLAQERDETVRLSLARALSLGNRRLKQQIRSENHKRALGVKLKTVEMSFDYLRSHILAGGSEADLHEEIDQVLATTAWSSLLDGEGEISVSRSVSAPGIPDSRSTSAEMRALPASYKGRARSG